MRHRLDWKEIPMGLQPTRRQFLSTSGLLATGTVLAAATSRPSTVAPSGPGAWDEADRIVRSTRRPRIPDRQVDLTSFGAVGNGTTDCTAAFAAAIAALARRGGGRLVVPLGRWLTGAIHLDNHIDLHIEADATILFRTDPAAYLPVVYTRDGGIECMNYSPFIYAYGKHDIAITGRGTLDGQSSNQYWWTAVHPAVPVPQRADLRDHPAQHAELADEPGAVHQRDRRERHGQQPGTQQRRLRPGMLRPRGHPGLYVRDRRRLHRGEGRQERRRAPGQPAEPEHRRPGLRVPCRARRDHHRQ
jgi:hypothetical protein